MLLPAEPPAPQAFPEASLERVLSGIRSFRLPFAGLDEWMIRDALADHLRQQGFPCATEHGLGSRLRADIWVEGGVVIELKKKRPCAAAVAEQLWRYAALPAVAAVVLVLERSLPLPREIQGKPCRVVSLNALWGIAL